MDVQLTQEEKDTLKADSNYRKYFVDSIMGDEAGGVAFLLKLTSFVDTTQASAWDVARSVRKTPNLVLQDPILLDFIVLQIDVRELDKKDDSITIPPPEGQIEPDPGDLLLAQVIGYLNAANRITLLVGDYIASKGGA